LRSKNNENIDNRFPIPDFGRYRWNAGLNFDPGLDRKAERNQYRSALITRNRASRAVDQQEDDIKLQVATVGARWIRPSGVMKSVKSV
jgi:hypothetical protein